MSKTCAQCEYCAKFISRSGKHVCEKHGQPDGYVSRSATDKSPTYALTVDRAGSFFVITPAVLRLRQLQLMAIDAGMEEVPLACLKRFADLVRADARSEFKAEMDRAESQHIYRLLEDGTLAA